MQPVPQSFQRMITMSLGAAALIGLYLTSLYNYLLFHSLAEIFSILVAAGIFVIAWNSRAYIRNDYLIYVAVAYLYIAGLDLLHTLSYKGMSIFTDYDYYANQLWIAARYLESLSLVAAFYFLVRPGRLNPAIQFFAYGAIFAVIVLSVFTFRIFPVCFVEGEGLTTFKKVSEYIICLILAADMALLARYRDRFEPNVHRWLMWAVGFTIVSELAFTFYISNYGFSNLVGHYFKIFSYYLIYKAIIETGIVRPYDIIFRELVQKERHLEKARKAADVANRAKSEFLANMSHELRTPLNGILGYAQVLKREAGATEAQRAGLDVIDRSGRHLLNLINEILDLSKIEARKMEIMPTEFRLAEFLVGICRIVAVRAQEKGIEFRSHIPPDLPVAVRADEKRLGQVLLNLLSNAVKYTEEGEVLFSVSAIGPPAGEGRGSKWPLRFAVKDTGAGIPAHLIEEIFQPFKQIGEHQRAVEGTGLGLAISRKLARLMGGDIAVQSREGEGSAFHFDLTMEEARPAADPSAPEERAIVGYAGPRKRVLVADDRWENRAFLVNLLTQLGFEVKEAGNGAEVIDMAAAFRPDLIFMDLIMPVIDGFEATRRLRSDPETEGVRIVAVSASLTLSAQDIAREHGLDGFIPKPVDLPMLFSVLAELLALEWTRAAENSPAAADARQGSGGAEMPPMEEIERLYRLARGGDIMAIRAGLDRLAGQNSRHGEFVAQMRELAAGFQIKKIRERLAETLEASCP